MTQSVTRTHPPRVIIGDTVKLTGTGFGVNKQIKFYFSHETVSVGNCMADGTGAFTYNFVVPHLNGNKVIKSTDGTIVHNTEIIT